MGTSKDMFGVVSVVIADDHPATRKGVGVALEADPMILVVGTAEDGDSALDLARRLKPNVLLLDIEMPGMSGVEVASALRQEQSVVRILAFSAHSTRSFVEGMLRVGAAGYVTKEKKSEVLIEAVKAVAHGEGRWFVVPSLSDSVWGRLTDRETSVLMLLAEGRSNQDIAAALFISESTACNYLTKVYEKIDVSSAREAIAWAWAHGISSRPGTDRLK